MSIGNHPAFPCEAQGDRSVPQEHDYLQNGVWSSKFPGLMIRDWIAARALSALDMPEPNLSEIDKLRHRARASAVWAYAVADAMLAERDKAAATQQEQTS